MKRFKGFNPMLFAAAVIFLCVTVYSLVSNVTVYVRQRNWPVATATVIDVAENGKEYNITYQYEARGNVYTGKLHRGHTGRQGSPQSRSASAPGAASRCKRCPGPHTGR